MSGFAEWFIIKTVVNYPNALNYVKLMIFIKFNICSANVQHFHWVKSIKVHQKRLFAPLVWIPNEMHGTLCVCVFLFCFAGDPNEGRVIRMERSSRLAIRFAARRQQQNSPQRWSRARLRLPFEAGCCDCTLPRRPADVVRTTRIYGKR